MEDKKDFDKDKQEMGTQQMPHVPTEGDEDGKKGIIVLFGHEFDKKKAVMAGLGGLLAIALIGGGVWYAASQKPEPKEPTPIEQTEKQEQQVIQLGAKADGWVKGEYEVSFISPVDKDGSTYEVPKTAKVKSEVEEKDGKDAGDELPFEFKPIAPDKADADALNAIVKSVGDAVKKGDGTLTGANGTKVIELVKENAKANPNADKDKVDEEGQKAEEGVTDEASGGNAGASKPETGGNGDNAVNGGNSGSNGGSSNGGGGSKPQHTHNWLPQTTVVHHDAQYKTIHHDAVVECRDICNQCGADITGNVAGHMEQSFLNGGSCVSHSNKYIETSPAWDEQILVSNAWDETVTTGYKCSGCPATK